MSNKRLTVTQSFAAITFLLADAEGKEAVTEALERQDKKERLADAFADYCNSLYDGVPEVVSRATAGRTMRDFLPPMKRVRR